MRKIFLIVGLVVIRVWSVAQVPSNLIGSNAPGLQWYQLKSEKVKIIFPTGVDKSAQRIANIIHVLNETEDSSIGELRIQVPIILHSESAISNGFVTVGPFRSEFFPIQRQFGNSTDYLDLLAIHEYRHAVQFANATRGITSLAKKTLGSWAWGGLMATALPRWYFEGDAVIAETEASHSGRGRLPSFRMQYDVLFKDNVIYNYEKASAGSLIDYVPDWYPLGYNILTFGRKNYGEDLWREVMEDAVRYKGIFYPFNRALKRRTGMSVSQMYNKAFEALQEEYDVKNENLKSTSFKVVGAKKSKFITSFLSPKIHKKDTIVVRSSYDRLPELTKISNGIEKKLCEIGRQIDGAFATISLGGNVIVWSEFRSDVRWRYRQYNDIYSFDLSSGIKEKVTWGQKYYSPSISDDDSLIVAVNYNFDLSPSLHILTKENGQVIARMKSEKFSQLSHPEWIDENTIVVVATLEEQSQLVRINISTNEWQEITPLSVDQISHPFYTDSVVYYSSSYSGINNIYSVHIDSHLIRKMTECPIGAYQPFVSRDNGNLFYVEQDREGFKVKKLIAYSANRPKYQIKPKMLAEHGHEPNSLLGVLPDSIFEVKKFNKWSGLLNPHSLLPQINHPIASISLRSDNVFGTLSGQIGGLYNYNEDEASYFATLNYAELFPILNFSYTHSYRAAEFFNFRKLSEEESIFTNYRERWLEDKIAAGFVIPFNLSRGNVNSSLNVSANYQYANISVLSSFDNENNFRDTIASSPQINTLFSSPINSATVSTLDIGIVASSSKRLARLHLKPKWGGSISFRYRTQLTNNLTGGDVFNTNTSLFVPGLASTHSLFFRGAYQKESSLDNYRYSDLFQYSRGYDLTLRRDSFLKLSANYSFPLYYPDVAIGPFAFVKRVKANLFYDYGRVQLNSPVLQSTENMSSIGIELGFDVRALRLVEVDFGLRYSYRMNPELSFNGKSHHFDFFVISITQ